MTDMDAVATARKAHIDAFNRMDVEAMASVVADDLVGMPPNTPPIAGKEAARAWWKAGFDAAQAHFGFTPTELVVADDLAFDRFAWTMETTPKDGGQAIQDNGDCVWIWKKQSDGSWLMWRAIWNSHNETPGVWSGASRD
jgi:ketosteroid isomerase-like protein